LKFIEILEKNKALKSIHSGMRCFIIGSGPSIKNQDLLPLKNDIKIVLNFFDKHEHCQSIKPDYWVCADPVFWKKQEKYLVPLLDAIEQLKINTKIFFPLHGMEHFKISRGMFLNFYAYMFDGSKTIDSPIDFTYGIPPYGQNVTLVALMLAIYMGCNPIYLIGCDHTWWGYKKEEYTDTNTLLPHFFKSFYPPMSQDLSYDILQSTIWVQKYQYLQIKKYANQNGFQIFNATEKGYLDLFQRVKYEDLFIPGSQNVINILTEIPDISHITGNTAIKLMNEELFEPALILIDAAIHQNTNKDSKIVGLDYLRSICLMKLGKKIEAIKAARQDLVCNKCNRENSLNLLRALGDDFTY